MPDDVVAPLLASPGPLELDDTRLFAQWEPLAAAHLQASIRTGLACRYNPAPGGPSRWRV